MVLKCVFEFFHSLHIFSSVLIVCNIHSSTQSFYFKGLAACTDALFPKCIALNVKRPMVHVT